LSEASAPGSRQSGRAHLEIELDALERNFAAVAAEVSPAGVMPVLKADAYGHGAVVVARTLEPLGTRGFLVARPEEGVELRRAGVGAPILIGSPPSADLLDLYAEHALQVVITGLEQFDFLESYAAATGWRPAVHLKLDTGMHRLGVSAAELPAALERLRASAALSWVGLMSHLGDAERRGGGRNAAQLAAFAAAVERLTAHERESVTIHLANSAGALGLPASRWDVVRPGLALFGGEVPGSTLELAPVLSIHARVRQVQGVGAGEAVGYGGLWTAPRASRIGVVGIGYADGYPWRAGGAARALVAGRRVPVVGAVSMDLLALDLTGGGEVGDAVVLLGRQGGEEIRLAELAAWAGTIPYEILCHQRLRLPRVHLRGGRPVDARRDATAVESTR